jgi:TAT (twin-arginine translocation) pathway signal sequence
MNITRRRFLQTSAAAVGVAAFEGVPASHRAAGRSAPSAGAAGTFAAWASERCA